MASFTVMLVGKTGHGKSTLANVLLGLKDRSDSNFYFKTGGDDGFSLRISVEPQAYAKIVQGITLRVIDTPGFFDTELIANERWIDVLKAVNLAGNSLDALVLVVNSREMNSGARSLKIAQDHMGDFISNRLIVAFTHVTDSQPDEIYLANFNRELKKGCFGASYIFMRDVFSEEGRQSKMEEMVEILHNVRAKSKVPITKDNFREYTRAVFKENVGKMELNNITYEDITKLLKYDVELIEGFLSRKGIQDILLEINEEKQRAKREKEEKDQQLQLQSDREKRSKGWCTTS